MGVGGELGYSLAVGDSAWRAEQTCPQNQMISYHPDDGMAIQNGTDIVVVGGGTGSTSSFLCVFSTITRTWTQYQRGAAYGSPACRVMNANMGILPLMGRAGSEGQFVEIDRIAYGNGGSFGVLTTAHDTLFGYPFFKNLEGTVVKSARPANPGGIMSTGHEGTLTYWDQAAMSVGWTNCEKNYCSVIQPEQGKNGWGLGGYSADVNPSTMFVDPMTLAFTRGPDMIDARCWAPSIRLPDGSIMVAGGYGLGGTYLNRAERLVGGVWIPSGSLKTHVFMHCGVWVHGWDIWLVIGGNNGASNQKDVNVFQYNKNLWSNIIEEE